MKSYTKKRTVFLLTVIFLLSSCTPVTKTDSGSSESKAGETGSCAESTDTIDEKDNIMSHPLSYDIETYMTPFWKGDTVYHEAVTFIQSENGDLEAPLFYKSDIKIISVYDMTLRKKYVEGEDYIYDDGMLKLTENTRCPYYKYDECYPELQGDTALAMTDKQHYTVYEDRNDMGGRQLAVTYTHSDSYTGYVPEYKGDLLPKTVKRLKNKEKIKIVFYGDSITAGWGSSIRIPAPPSMPDYTVQFSAMMMRKLDVSVSWVNSAVGGTGIDWAYDNVESKVNCENPDLVVIAFGMNDGGYTSAREWTDKLKQLTEKISASNPDCEFLLVSTMWANPEADGWNRLQPEFEEEMLKLETEGIAVVQVTSLHESVMNAKKRNGVSGEDILGYVDTSGNNVNHPNDFFTRLYAQALYATITEDYR